jgi:hypothetical protein
MLNVFVDRALEVDPREAKLPVWAKDKLDDMRRATIDATKALDLLMHGTEPSAFWLESRENNKRFYLPRNIGQLKFQSGDSVITLMEGRNNMTDWLWVQGDSSILVAPSSSNVVYIRTKE